MRALEDLQILLDNLALVLGEVEKVAEGVGVTHGGNRSICFYCLDDSLPDS